MRTTCPRLLLPEIGMTGARASNSLVSRETDWRLAVIEVVCYHCGHRITIQKKAARSVFGVYKPRLKTVKILINVSTSTRVITLKPVNIVTAQFLVIVSIMA